MKVSPHPVRSVRAHILPSTGPVRHLQHHLQPNRRAPRKQDPAPETARPCARIILPAPGSHIQGLAEIVPRLRDLQRTRGGPLRTLANRKEQRKGRAHEEEDSSR